MTIADAREKCKSLIVRIPRDGLIIGVLLVSSILSFVFGFLAGLDVSVPTLTGALSQSIDASTTTATSAAGSVVASKNGTKYYLPSCSGADRISAANKVTFVSPAAAAAAGYTPAANCPGL